MIQSPPRRKSDREKENTEADCVSCVVSKKCPGKCGVCAGATCDNCLTACPNCVEIKACGNCSIDGVCLNCNSMQ